MEGRCPLAIPTCLSFCEGTLRARCATRCHIMHAHRTPLHPPRGRLTREVGMPLAELPLPPLLGRALLAASKLGCLQEMVVVAAMMSVPRVWQVGVGVQPSLFGWAG